MNPDVLKKIEVLNMLADGSLSMMSLGDHKWQIHAYVNDTFLGNDTFYGETLEGVIDKALQGAINVKNIV